MSWTNTVDMTRPWIRERAQGRTRTAVWTDGCARLVIHRRASMVGAPRLQPWGGNRVFPHKNISPLRA